MTRVCCGISVVLVVWTTLALGVAPQLNAPGTLAAEATDLNPVTFTLVNGGGDPAIPDVIVSEADSGNGTYLDIDTIIGRAGPGDTIAVAIDAATSWSLTAAKAGTVAIGSYSDITFSAIDNLIGAASEDTFVFSPGLWSAGGIDGGPGTNTLDYSARSTGVSVNLTSGTATGTGGISRIQNVIGGSGNDTITGDSQANVITGGPGRDSIAGGDGDGPDTVVEIRNAGFTLTNTGLTIGSEGKDTLSGIEAACLTGGVGDNTLDASDFAGSAVLDGAGGNDILKGGSGNDVLIGGPGNDILSGGPGNDEYTGGPGTNTLTEAAGGGVDTVVETCDADFTVTNVNELIWSEGTETFVNIENVHLTGGPGDNDFNLSMHAGVSVSVDGEAGYDTLTLAFPASGVTLITGGVVAGSQSASYEAIEAVTLDGDAVVSADATLNAGEYNLDSLTVTGGSVLTLASDVSATVFQGVTITTSGDLTVTAGSLISADGQGYAGDQGPGAGATASSDSTYGGGGGYGGPGGNGDGGALGGTTYGSAAEPTDLGSGGGFDGGKGGGAVRLVVDGTLLLDGGIVCRGVTGGYHSGGGSGGSVYLTVGTLTGAGMISADGGEGGEGGGGGGGGRIAIYCGTNAFSGTMTASGGAGFEPGGTGTGLPQDFLEVAIVALRGLTAAEFTNARSCNALTNKLEAAIASIEVGLYQDALMKLRHDVLPKMDGCATQGTPDKDDWIITCTAQQEIYPLVLQAIQLLEDLI